MARKTASRSVSDADVSCEIDEREIETGLLFLGSDLYVPVDSI